MVNNVIVSYCCFGPVRVVGKTTQYYVCEDCGKPCDPYWVDQLTEIVILPPETERDDAP